MRSHLLSMVIVAAACSPGDPHPGLDAENATIRSGEYLVTNNWWGKALATGDHSQSIFLEQREEGPVFGWDWSWLGTGVVAYPSVFYGDSPFDATRTTSKLPMPVGSRGITVQFEARTEAAGVWDSAFDLFLTSTPDARRGTRTHEIMIWTEASQLVPAGTVVGELEVGGVVWDLYCQPEMDLAQYGWPEKFVYAAYLARQPVTRGPLDLGAFLADLLARGDIPAGAYLASISFGNEVQLGTGHTEVAGYAIEVE